MIYVLVVQIYINGKYFYYSGRQNPSPSPLKFLSVQYGIKWSNLNVAFLWKCNKYQLFPWLCPSLANDDNCWFCHKLKINKQSSIWIVNLPKTLWTYLLMYEPALGLNHVETNTLRKYAHNTLCLNCLLKTDTLWNFDSCDDVKTVGIQFISFLICIWWLWKKPGSVLFSWDQVT